jgi:hypothetical protein
MKVRYRGLCSDYRKGLDMKDEDKIKEEFHKLIIIQEDKKWTPPTVTE